MKIIFEFIGGFRDGKKAVGIHGGPNKASAHYWVTANGTVGAQTTILLPAKKRVLGAKAEEYKVTHRVEKKDGSEVLVRCKFAGLVSGSTSNKRAKPRASDNDTSRPVAKGTMKLAEGARAELSAIMEIGDANLTLEEFLQAQLDKELGDVLTNTASEYPHLSQTELKSFCRFFYIIDLEDGWLSRGVARRVMLNSPDELRKFLSMRSRLTYLWNKSIYDAGLELDSPYTLVWNVLQALAARDHDAAHAYLKLGISPLQQGQRDAVVISNAVYAILSGKAKSLSAAAEQLKSQKASNQQFAGIFAALAGVIHRSPKLVGDGLSKTLDSKNFWIHHYERVICIEAHGLVELARTVSPRLLSTFDFDRPLPWDKEFYASTLSAKSPLDGTNLKMLPSDMRTAIVQLKVPKWLRFPDANA